jgi:hypothetical protein
MNHKQNNNKLSKYPFGHEQIHFIDKELLLSVLDSGIEAIPKLINIIHHNPKISGNNNIYMNDDTRYAIIYGEKTMLVRISKEELISQLIYVKTQLIVDLMDEFNINSDEYSQYNKKSIAKLKIKYLKLRTGLLEDDRFFTKNELDEYENIKKFNLKNLNLLLQEDEKSNDSDEDSDNSKHNLKKKFKENSSESDNDSKNNKKLMKKKTKSSSEKKEKIKSSSEKKEKIKSSSSEKPIKKKAESSSDEKPQKKLSKKIKKKSKSSSSSESE